MLTSAWFMSLVGALMGESISEIFNGKNLRVAKARGSAIGGIVGAVIGGTLLVVDTVRKANQDSAAD